MDGAGGSASHLYVHLPYCRHRCGYCDFVTVVGRHGSQEPYVDALLRELALERDRLAEPLETIFLGGGTPTFLAPALLERVLATLPSAREVTVEANPETVDGTLARLLHDGGVTRVSLGAQSFRPDLLSVLERRAGPGDVRRAWHALRDACFDNISLDLLYGIPGQSASDLERDLAEALALEPEHLSCYELEAKPGTRFAHTWGRELDRQAAAVEGYFELVAERLEAAGYRWYETASFCRRPDAASGRDLRAQHNLGIWRGHDYLGVGIGAVSTVGGVRWRNRPSLGGYVGALAQGRVPARDVEPLDLPTRAWERVMLGLRLDEPLPLAGVPDVVDPSALARLETSGLVERIAGPDGGTREIRLTRRGRFLGGAVTAELLRPRDEIAAAFDCGSAPLARGV